ncbi:hypothetical protein M2302_004503 [Micromonospora sp. A200]|nr:hypothetical protein [Micromonospora sp. A200]
MIGDSEAAAEGTSPARRTAIRVRSQCSVSVKWAVTDRRVRVADRSGGGRVEVSSRVRSATSGRSVFVTVPDDGFRTVHPLVERRSAGGRVSATVRPGEVVHHDLTST